MRILLRPPTPFSPFPVPFRECACSSDCCWDPVSPASSWHVSCLCDHLCVFVPPFPALLPPVGVSFGCVNLRACPQLVFRRGSRTRASSALVFSSMSSMTLLGPGGRGTSGMSLGGGAGPGPGSYGEEEEEG